MSIAQTVSLGSFIRIRRERISPEQAGLPVGLRRRAKGLRREELAGLCGMSPTWLTPKVVWPSPLSFSRDETILAR
jgi:hypothetical protein